MTVLENHTLTQAEDENSMSMRTIMPLSVLPFFLLFLAVLAVLAPRLQDFCALWLFWNLDSMTQ